MRSFAYIFQAAIFLLIPNSSMAQQDFFFAPTDPLLSGELHDCKGFYDPGTPCRKLLQAFAYSKAGVGWEAPAGMITDGASIPKWAQGIIGEPMAEAFLKAALLHDHYCRRRVRTYLATDRMFYDALVDSGVEPLKAGVMYAAVLVGGPSWTVLMEPQACSGDVSNCVRNATEGYGAINETPADYGTLDMEAIVAELNQIAAAEGLQTPEAFERLALQSRLSLNRPAPAPYLEKNP